MQVQAKVWKVEAEEWGGDTGRQVGSNDRVFKPAAMVGDKSNSSGSTLGAM